jgi:hypothetical protein
MVFPTRPEEFPSPSEDCTISFYHSMLIIAMAMVQIYERIRNLAISISMKIRNSRVALKLVRKIETTNARDEELLGLDKSDAEDSVLSLTELGSIEERVQDLEERLARVEAHVREAIEGDLVSQDGSAHYEERILASGDTPRGHTRKKRAENGSSEGHGGDGYVEEDGQIHTAPDAPEVNKWYWLSNAPPTS